MDLSLQKIFLDGKMRLMEVRELTIKI